MREPAEAQERPPLTFPAQGSDGSPVAVPPAMHEHVNPIRLSVCVGPEDESARPFVRCPRRAESVDVLDCVRCDRLRSLTWNASGGELTCVTENGPARRPSVDRRADCAEAAVRAPVHDTLERTVTCVTADLPIEQLRRLMAERGLRAVAVVDADGKLEGIVSRDDLTTAATFGLVGDMMVENVTSLQEDAPIAHAIALMAFENVTAVPVVTSEGKVVGMYDALDALRWVAGRMGWATRAHDHE